MKLSITSLWAILILFVTGCTSQKEVVETPTPPFHPTVKLDAKTLTISFEQTACFGTCPVHKMEVFGSGYATYHGDRNVANEGEFIATLSNEQLLQIIAKANTLNFFDLKESYKAKMTDLPTTIIYINDGTRKHKVTAYGNYPDNLKAFITYLFDFSQNVKWGSNK